MARVTGLGGVFFKSEDPARMTSWLQDTLGIVPQADGSIMFEWREKDAPEQVGATVFAPFPQDTTYFAPSTSPYMFNFRVDDLEGLLTNLRAAGVTVDDKVEEYEFGKFGWIMDPEGHRIELWEPAGGVSEPA